MLGDIRDPEVMLAATRKIDVVVHAAALPGIHLAHYKPDDFWQLNVTGTHNVYQSALKNHV
ncbi:polysaccharide biosynthesis protein [Brevibacillus sp. H7]|uniref:polysaccharide biosynthesis protein n=1 Tax=Brevibacillus sp. H7 TaxID=3349138 RepID=UPI0037F67627